MKSKLKTEIFRMGVKAFLLKLIAGNDAILINVDVHGDITPKNKRGVLIQINITQSGGVNVKM